MRLPTLNIVLFWLVSTFLTACHLEPAATPADPLPSWADGPSRTAIVEYVQAVTDSNNSDFIPVNDRIAVFDNDGTLWSEQPMYFQLAFAFHELARMAPANPHWADDEAFSAVLSGDRERVAELERDAYLRIIAATHGGMPNRQFAESVRTWMNTAKHPVTGRRFDKMIYQPMRELLDYLRDNRFSVYIVSGGMREFMRVFAEDVYGVPPQNVIGTMMVLEFVANGETMALMRAPEVSFVNDGPGKPVGIQQAIGKRPVFAFGNSDGDLEMLQWTDGSNYRSFQGIVRHTDAEREWAYDRESEIGHLDKGLAKAGRDGWTVVDMKSEWKTIHVD